MAESVNRVTLLGFLDRDPEVRVFSDSSRVAWLTISTFDELQSGKLASTQCHRVSIFDNDLVDVVERDLRKGAKVFVEGKLESRNYVDVHGREFFSAEVVIRKGTGDIITFAERQGIGSAYDSDASE